MHEQHPSKVRDFFKRVWYRIVPPEKLLERSQARFEEKTLQERRDSFHRFRRQEMFLRTHPILFSLTQKAEEVAETYEDVEVSILHPDLEKLETLWPPDVKLDYDFQIVEHPSTRQLTWLEIVMRAEQDIYGNQNIGVSFQGEENIFYRNEDVSLGDVIYLPQPLKMTAYAGLDENFFVLDPRRQVEQGIRVKLEFES